MTKILTWGLNYILPETTLSKLQVNHLKKNKIRTAIGIQSFVCLVVISFSPNFADAEPRVLAPVVDNSTYIGKKSAAPIGGSTSNVKTNAYGSAAPTNNGLYEILGRLEQLQAEMQQLRGLVEEQSQTISELKKRQNNIYSDLDQRLQILSGMPVEEKTIADISTNQSSNKIKKFVTDEMALNKPVGGEQQLLILNDVKKDLANVEVIVKNQKEQYQEIYEKLRNGHNAAAISGFKSFLTEFPNGEYADDSQYWLGEAYKVDQNYVLAKKAFSDVIIHHGGSAKVADALLKLGDLEFDQDNMIRARDYYTQVTVSYPDSTASHLASKKLKQMRGY